MRHRYNLSFRREQQKKERIRRIIIIVIALFVFAALGTLIYFAWTGIDWGSVKAPADDKKAAEEKKEKPKSVEITINSVGEITCYDAQLKAAETDNGYDFSSSFENVSKYIKEADLALFDLETTFGGEPYKGYPSFNSPDELADAIKDAGFDVAITANEHALDSDIEGLERTIDTLTDAKLKSAGTKKDADDKDYLITKVNDVKVGIVAYTEETSYNADNRTLDGDKMSEEEIELINSYSSRVEDDMDRVKKSIDDAREDGAEIIICYFHWGDDYDTSANDTEKEIAESLVDMGADMIFGTHPHVVQEIDTIKNDDGQEVPVFYSLGNFLSTQRYETVGTRSVEEGMIAQVKLTFDTTTGKITDMEYGYIPTWIDRYWVDDIDTNRYTIVPLVGVLEDNPILIESDHLSNAERALDNLKESLGDPLIDATKSDDDSETGD